MGEFESFQAFIEMGGHGLYVWLAYAVGAVVIGGNIWWVGRIRKLAEQRLRKYVRRQELEG